MKFGYIYCLSNVSMPGILKIGMTIRNPEIRLLEANMADTWRPPTPYKIEFAKKVFNFKEKEKTLHKLLEKYAERVNPKREFFKVSIEDVRLFFDLIDGEQWVKTSYTEDNLWIPHEEDEPYWKEEETILNEKIMDQLNKRITRSKK